MTGLFAPAHRYLLWLLALICLGTGCANAEADLQGVWFPRATPAGGLRASGNGLPPLTERGRALYDKQRAEADAGKVTTDLTRTRCASPGFPRILTFPYPFQVLQQPDELIFLSGWNGVFRQINVGAPRDPYVLPSAMGYAAGHWDGETLVVVSSDFGAQTWLDSTGLPRSDKLKVTERLTLHDQGRRLESLLVIDDPDMYQQPWTVRLQFDRRGERLVTEDVCQDRLQAGSGAIEARSASRARAVKSR